MPVAIQVKVDIGKARAVLARARDLGLHPGPLLEIAGGVLEESVRERFRTGHGPGGIPWPVSGRQRFAARPGGKPSKGEGRRSAIGPNRGGRTLVDTGGLESSITHVADDKQVEVGFIAKTQSAKFAYVHQFGATIRPKKGPFLIFTGSDGHKVFARQVVIPARPMLGIDDNDRADLLEAWTAYIESELAK